MWKLLFLTVAPAASDLSVAGGPAIPIEKLQATEPVRSVQHLYESCNQEDAVRRMYCSGFLTAAMSGLFMLGVGNESQFKEARKVFGICTLPTTTVGAAVQVFKNWAAKHREAWGIDAYPGVVFALQEAWPCK